LKGLSIFLRRLFNFAQKISDRSALIPIADQFSEVLDLFFLFAPPLFSSQRPRCSSCRSRSKRSSSNPRAFLTFRSRTQPGDDRIQAVL